jgi:tetratricopeptide (TPR) repeat protein
MHNRYHVLHATPHFIEAPAGEPMPATDLRVSASDATAGMQLAQMGRFAEALPYLDRANRHAPTDVPLLHAVASLLLSAQRPGDAAERYRIAASLLPGDAGVLTGWARVLLLLGDIERATEALDRALAIDPHIAAPRGLLSMAWNIDDPDSACAVMRQLVGRHPGNADLALQYAQALHTAEYLDEALAAFEGYRLLRPDDPLACIELGRLAAGRGESARALDCFRAAIAIDPDHPRALAEIAQAERGPLTRETLVRVRELAESVRDTEDGTVLNDVLARHYDRAGDFRTAAVHAARMKALQERMVAPQLRYNPEQHELEIDTAIALQTAQFFDRLRDAGSDDRRPVFVVGLPRSGTTLLERMLASHPRIVGVGEQLFAKLGLQRALAASGGMLQSLAPSAVHEASAWHLRMLEDRVQRLSIRRDGERIVDKLPDNYLLAGWLSLAFPHAAIIHCLRDPRDVALSCWLTQFARIQWCFRLEHIAHRIEQHRRLMRHWRATIGERLTEIRYERLVANPEAEIRRALAAIGVDWHADVLGFAERKGFVGSASRHQVRESLHARSIERWRNYEGALQPFLPRLHAIAAQDEFETDDGTTPADRVPGGL